ncbi:Fe-S-cluster oxidoreductase [Thiocystis violacea]|uniref:Fe-S-cluster oxidoreductase n=1 Tax=Thiocystis violacea TaxID=13725 RepID=UPI001F5B93DE|nr:Fe-S-cluster oxidoreductase [Thiocystis violacea]
MPDGKAAGVPCVQLTADLSCGLFGSTQRPSVCASLAPTLDMCGLNREQAFATLTELERLTCPSA